MHIQRRTIPDGYPHKPSVNKELKQRKQKLEMVEKSGKENLSHHEKKLFRLLKGDDREVCPEEVCICLECLLYAKNDPSYFRGQIFRNR